MMDVDDSKIDSFGNGMMASMADVTWKDLQVKISSSRLLPCFGKKEEKIILSKFSGTFKASSLVAVMGSSGAGKTTFLNALAGQIEGGGITEGEVFINDKKLTKGVFRKTCGFVKQSDVLLPNLTVFETLSFYANLVLPLRMSRKEKRERIMLTIRKLGLETCMNTPIGNDFKRGISGGEKRRVSIAVELLKNPPVLFLDEPTSGLDSKTALNMITTLSELAHEYNHTIICTIHQPRSQIYEMFDTLLLLARGNPVYFGDTSNALDYFESKGHPCPQYESPSDFFIDSLTVDTESDKLKEESNRRIDFFIEEAKNEGFNHKTYKEPEPDPLRKYPGGFGTIIPHQIMILFMRMILNKWRDTQYLFGRIVQAIFVAIMISVLWWQMDNDQSAIRDRVSTVFMLLLGGAFSESLIASLVFPLDRLIYLREKKSGLYSVFSYYVAVQLAELPLQFAVPTIYFVIVYFSVGFQYTVLNFGQIYLFFILLVFIVNSFGMFFGALLQVQLASILIPVLLIVNMLFAGFYVNTQNIPSFVEWMKYISIFYYTFSGAVVTEFGNRTFYCKNDQYVVSSISGTCSNGEVITVTTEVCPITNGQQVIDSFGVPDLTQYQYQLILLSFIIVLRGSIYFLLHKPPNRI